MARAGRRVLFIEKGASGLSGDGLRGDFAERLAGTRSGVDAGVLARAGRRGEPMLDISDSRPYRFVPYIGEGTGGSSALYGMALERMFPHDFAPRERHPDAAHSTLPDRWPIGYDELAPYYAEAERLYRVRGTGDPLRTSEQHGYVGPLPARSAAASELASVLERNGLHPYRLPLACDFVPGCAGCQGYLCAQRCKNDSAKICLEPAIARNGAALADRCEAVRVETARGRVSAVVAHQRGVEHRFRGDVFVLAAGALATPLLLLRSRSPEWPRGLANASGLVGRNLMRHFVDLYAVVPHETRAARVQAKELAFNDFYAGDAALGSVQSFGTMMPAGMLVDAMRDELREKTSRALAAGVRAVSPLIRRALDRLFTRSLLLATIAEDLPYRDNRVFDEVGTGNAVLHYRIGDHDRARIARLRGRMRTVLEPLSFRLIRQAENNERLAHACGTCRFGDDPRSSVLDRDNRAHGLANLLVLDASFFPSSGGTNPALTIAANALRVAHRLAGERASAGSEHSGHMEGSR